MTARDVRDCLLKRWPATEFVSIEEAPQTSDRQGRRLDVLVVSLWRSRGYELDGVEIKVSLSDWKRELAEAAKADWWWNHVHRFWVAVPAEITSKVRADLPTGWGLLSCTPEASTIVVNPDKHSAVPLSWGTTIGLIRAASGAGLNALTHAESRGYQRGTDAAQHKAEQSTGDARLRESIGVLTAKVAAFENASGLDIGKCWSDQDASRLGRLVKVVETCQSDPLNLAKMLTNQATQIERQAQSLRTTAESLCFQT
jgi:hypothetical protein